MANGSSCVHNSHYSWGSENSGFFRKPHFVIDFKRNDSNYESILDSVNEMGSLIIKRKYLKLRVRNTGTTDVPKCVVKITIPESGTNVGKRHPSDTKTLCWVGDESNFIPLDRKTGEEYVYLLITDSKMHNDVLNGADDVYALAGTKETVQNTSLIRREQDGFGIGDLDVTIIITGGGVSLTNIIKIHVDQNFENTTVIPFEFESPINIISRTYNRLRRRRVSNPTSAR
jgi:hypothetical protein